MAETPAGNSYQPLARKYRPMEFAELVGQESVATALANAISIGREPHGVIFSGVRGIGKTTTARLYAKALNCDKGPTPQPCGKCESCRAITIGNHEDVLEIDGASNTGVDDVRALRETVSYVPQRSKFKIYIIDEVHMLSQSAFNALLKTLEEPPRHVVFVFATTELHRIPATIVGRCQVFNLRKLTTRDIAGQLEKVLTAERIPFEVKALQVVAREGHGSMRDALTLLDQVIALGGGSVHLSTLKNLIVTVSSTHYFDMLDALISRNGELFVKLVEFVDLQGVQFTALVEELAMFARHAFVIRDIGPAALDLDYLQLDDEEKQRLSAIGKKAAPFDLNRIFRTLIKCRNDMDGSAMDRFIFENYGLEWCLDPGLPDFQRLLSGGVQTEAPSTLNKEMSETMSTGQPAAVATGPVARGSLLGAFNEMMAAESKGSRAGASASPPPPTPTPTPTPAPTPASVSQAKNPVAFPPTWPDLVEAWKRLKPLQARKLEEAHPVVYSEATISLTVPFQSLAASSLLNRDEQNRLRDVFRELFGFDGVLEISALAQRDHTDTSPLPHTVPESILQERARKVAGEREQVVESVKSSPMTKEALAILGGKVEDVRITDTSIAP